MKSNSIVQFERLYLASIAVWLVRQLITAGQNVADVAEVGVDHGTAWAAFAGMTLLVLAIATGVWYMIVRRHSVVFKWLLSLWFVLNTCVVALAIFRIGLAFNLPIVLDFVGYGLGVWALSYLFKPDAEAWFGRG